MMLLTRRQPRPNYWRDSDEVRRIESRVQMTVDRFTAWAMCPECESVDCHWIREPTRLDDIYLGRARASMFENLSMLPMESWQFSPSEPEPFKSKYEVIRTCKSCGREWGQN